MLSETSSLPSATSHFFLTIGSFGNLDPNYENVQVQDMTMRAGKSNLPYIIIPFTLGIPVLLMFIFTIQMLENHEYRHITYVNFEGYLRQTNKKFLSVALDTSNIASNFSGLDTTDPRIIYLMKQLSPAYLRVGGNMADCLTFSPNESTSNDNISDKNMEILNRLSHGDYIESLTDFDFTMTGDQWLALNKLSEAANFNLVFDLNVLKRTKNGDWNYTNADELFDFSNRHSLDNINWELGNEPNAFEHRFNKQLSATQLAEDFKSLRRALRRYYRYRNSLIIGPDTTRPQQNKQSSLEYFKEFLTLAGNTVDVVSWHHYYFDGKTATVEDFLNTTIFDWLIWQIKAANSVTKNLGLSQPVWLGETSSAWGGGAANLSDRFIGSFIWIDKLGLAAKLGLDVVIRQSIFGGFYSLIGDDHLPNPDWWISLFYKRLVSEKVLLCKQDDPSKVRLYCHCTLKAAKDELLDSYSHVTVFGANVGDTEAQIKIQNIEAANVSAYILTSKDSLQSREIQLNGNPLQLTSEGTLPEIEPKIVPSGPFLLMPPYSIGFWVIPTPHFRTCM